MKTFLFPLCLTLLFALAGCSTVESRIQEKSSTFASLPPDQQKVLREGRVELGFTEDMAYIALGKPDEIQERRTDAGVGKTWIYLEYSEDYLGEQRTGYARRVIVDPRTGRLYVQLIPVHSSVYRERVEPVLRIEFTEGRVSALEQPKTEK